jgi:hypothetical protein
MVILSDGDDTISRHAFHDVVLSAIRAEIPIYTLNTGRPRTFVDSIVLREMAALTGGCSFTRAPGAPSALASVLDDLRNAYVLTYELPSHSEGLHSVNILPTTNSNLHLRSRRSYYYGVQTSVRKGD